MKRKTKDMIPHDYKTYINLRTGFTCRVPPGEIYIFDGFVVDNSRITKADIRCEAIIDRIIADIEKDVQ